MVLMNFKTPKLLFTHPVVGQKNFFCIRKTQQHTYETHSAFRKMIKN